MIDKELTPGQILGRLGGIARAKKLSPERRSEIAKKAVDAREAKRKKKKDDESKS